MVKRNRKERNRGKRKLAAYKRLKTALDNPKPKPTPLEEIASEFIAEIEELFGLRDSSFTYIGLKTDEPPGPNPKNWFPDLKGSDVQIWLGEKAKHDRRIAEWQLAHECFHLLDPWKVDIYGPLNFLEEGLATWYQDLKIPGVTQSETDQLYRAAKDLVKPFMPELADVVKHIRTQHRVRIGDIDQEILLGHCPTMKPEVAGKLCSPFDQS